MEEVRDGHALGAGMEAEEPGSLREPPSPPPAPSPLSPSAPESPGLPTPEQPSEAHARQLLLKEWGPPGGSLELPRGLTWKLLFLRRPLYRNLLRSPNPEGAACGSACPRAPVPRPPASRFVSRSRCLFVAFSVVCADSPCVSLGSHAASSLSPRVSVSPGISPSLPLAPTLGLCSRSCSLDASLRPCSCRTFPWGHAQGSPGAPTRSAPLGCSGLSFLPSHRSAAGREGAEWVAGASSAT